MHGWNFSQWGSVTAMRNPPSCFNFPARIADSSFSYLRIEYFATKATITLRDIGSMLIFLPLLPGAKNVHALVGYLHFPRKERMQCWISLIGIRGKSAILLGRRKGTPFGILENLGQFRMIDMRPVPLHHPCFILLNRIYTTSTINKLRYTRVEMAADSVKSFKGKCSTA